MPITFATTESELPSPTFAAALEDALQRPLPLADGWYLWRMYAVRGGGFPIETLQVFVDDALGTRLETTLADRRRCAEARGALHAYLRAQLAEDAKLPGRPWHRALQAVQKRRPQIPIPAHDAIARDLAVRYAAARDARQVSHDAYRRAYPEATRRWSHAAAEIAADVDFRAAVAWQNEPALAAMLRHYAAADEAPDGARARQYRRLVASYLQRYCAKNEQIGFFGPCGWGLVDGASAALIAAPVPARTLQVYFEYWAVAALADRAARLAPEALTPRLAPDVRLEADELVLPDAVLPLDVAQHEFLAALDGRTSVARLSARYAGQAGSGIGGPEAMRQLLGRLAQAGVIDWQLPIPVSPDASRALESSLIDRPGLEDFLTAWRALDAARAALAAAPRAEMPRRIARLNADFATLAGTSSHRHAGAVYAGRAPLYADAVREIELRLPDTVFQALAPALVPVLASAQWYSQQLLTQYLAYVTAVWRKLAGGADVPLAALWRVLQAETTTAIAIGEDVVEQLQERWRELLHVDDAQRRQQFEAEALAARARAAFTVDGPLWTGARFQAPDLLIAATDLEAIERGEWLAVLGEIHPCTNLMMQTVTGKLCPVRGAALAATARIQCESELLPALAREALGHRTAYSLELDHDFTIEYGANRSAGAPERVLRIADILVRGGESGPQLELRDGSRRWPLAQFFGPQLRSIGISRFKPFAVAGHLPRLTIGRLVLQRESWSVPSSELAFVRERDRAERWLALHTWARTLGLPRYCFYRVAGERKPWFLDLASPVYCELFADTVRRAGEGTLTLAEMLPDPTQCWLRDGSGKRYGAELRMAAYRTG